MLPKWVFPQSSLIRDPQIFEAIGIDKEVIDKYFTNTVSRVGGITMKDIAEETDKLHSGAFDPLGLDVDETLYSIGRHKMRSAGEHHRYNPADHSSAAAVDLERRLQPVQTITRIW